MKNSGEQFIHQKEGKLHTSKEVEHEMERKKRKGEKVSQKPAEKLKDWFSLLERTHLSHRDDPRVVERIKKYYHKKHVLKPENIPQNYWNLQAKMMIEEGRGAELERSGIKKEKVVDKKGKERINYLFPKEVKEQNAEVLVKDQESTLDNWLDYYISPDSDSFPMWAKYWSFNGMLKLSTYDKEKQSFGKRKKDTVAPFADLNREALAKVIDSIVKKANKEQLPTDVDNEEFKKLLQGANFGKLYAYAIEKITPIEESELQITEGQWVKYDQNSDHTTLVESLEGYGTGWCTAGESTAKTQLKNGDFYVYYSNDKDNNSTVPRIAIRMNGKDEIAEVRGIAKQQNMDSVIANTDILDSKLEGFGDEGKAYQKKSKDMKRLTEIVKKDEKGKDLSKEDLKFLYEVDDTIQGFGYGKDPRVNELIDGRDVRKDLSFAIGCKPEQISFTKEEVLSGNIKFHYGDLDLRGLTSAEGLKLPENIRGGLDLRGLTSAEGLKFPENIRGGLDLRGLTSAEGLKLPESCGAFSLDSLTSVKGLRFPKNIRCLYLNKLTSIEGLEGILERVEDEIDLGSITSAKDLRFPKNINGDLILSSLTSTEDLTLPENIGGDLYLNGLTSAEDLTLPENIGGDLYLNGLTSAEGLELPEEVGEDLDLSGLTSAEGLKFPEKVGGDIDLKSLDLDEKERIKKERPDLNIE